MEMLKVVTRLAKVAILVFSLFSLAACGSGGGTGGTSSMTIELSGLTSTTLEAGTAISGAVQIKATSSALNGVTVTIKTDNSSVIGSAAATDGAGTAAFTLHAANNADLSKKVQVWAEYDGVKSNVLEIDLKSWAESSTLEFTEESTVSYPRSAVIGAPATTYSTIVSGNSLVFKDPSGSVVSGVPVEISITSFNGYSLGDVVSVLPTSGYVYYTGANPTSTATFVISSTDGKLDIPTTYTYVVPGAASPAGTVTSHTYSIVWQAKVTYGGREYFKTAVTSVSATTTSIDPPT